MRCGSGEVHREHPRAAHRGEHARRLESPLRRPDAYVDLRPDRRLPAGVVGLRHLPPGNASQATARAGGAARLRSRPELHVGPAQPVAATAGHRHGHSDSDRDGAATTADHHGSAAGHHHDDGAAAVRAANAAVPAAAALLPAEYQPDTIAPATAAGARSGAGFAAASKLTSPAGGGRRYTGVP